ncbi:MAG: lipoyl(octanoyl) transferase LipB [Pseudomonadota bacterium]
MSGVLWQLSEAPVAYPDAISFMEERAAAIRAGEAPETVWLVEHPPLYTAGTSADASELLDSGDFPVYRTGRGGRYTYHGPGQRVAYVMLDLKARGGDLKAFVRGLETWLIATLADFGVTGETRDDRVGVWVRRPGGEDKIAAIGIRVRRWVSFHGIAINVDPDLDHFRGIIPCGIQGHGVTSLSALGVDADMAGVDEALKSNFEAAMPVRQEAALAFSRSR